MAAEVVFYIGREVVPSVVGELLGPAVANLGIEPKNTDILNIYWEKPPESAPSWVHNTHKLIYNEFLQRPGNRRRSSELHIKCIFGGSIVGESKVSSTMLIEDRIGNESSYMDWLCLIHRLIQEQVEY
jgi:hypothetical protein